MYEEETGLHGSKLTRICYVCLCRTRKTLPLGEYAGIFNRIIAYSNVEDNHIIKLCWECLAVLNKIKVFESKCYIAQKILHSKWEKRQSPKCLTTLVMTPVKIDNHFGEDLNTNHGFRTEEKPYLCQKRIFDDVLQENYVQVDENESNIRTKLENNTFDDDMDDRSEFKYDFKGNNYLKNEIKEPQSEEISFKTDVETVIKSDTENNKEDLYKEINNVFNKKCQIKMNNNERLAKRKGLTKKDLAEHFKIVRVSPEKLKQLRSKCKIDAPELDFWRETEKNTEFYVDKPFKCQKCICVFSSHKKKYEHDKKYHDMKSGDYTCDVCTSMFPTKQELSAHVSKHYYVHRCNLCQYQCMSRHLMKHHMRRHKKMVVCVHCDACFSNINLFCKHFKSIHSVFICDHCGKKCRTKYTLEKHMRHHSEKNVCVTCNKVYASRNSLRNHMDIKHKETSSEMAYCVKCDKQFLNVSLYKRHVQTSKAHAEERDADRSKKEVACPICGNVYSRKTYMMNHYRHVHMKQSKHYCVDCDRHFLNRTRYVEHRKFQHEGETRAKDKMCNICGRGFAANRTLVNHIRTHSGERPYECQYCNAKFTQKHGMLSHIKYIHMKSKRKGFQ